VRVNLWKQSSGTDRTIRRQHLEAIGRAKLSNRLTTLFSELTGWTFNVRWAPPLAWDSELPFCSDEFCKAVCSEADAADECASFENECLENTLRAGDEGYLFTCPFGVHSYWRLLVVEDTPLAIIAVQFPKSGKLRRTRRANRAATGKTAALTQASRKHFDQARELAQVLADELRNSILAEIRLEDIRKLTQNVAAHEHIEASLRRDLHAKLPFVTEAPSTSGENNHLDQRIQGILHRIHADYDQPLKLQKIADEFGMNMAHLSKLFSCAVGMPFRSYVKEFRFEKARELLRDPTQRVSEVAYAVGYSDPNRFRLDFKERTGLSPTAWRDSLR
jgi:AraC-like DNA-binding protein